MHMSIDETRDDELTSHIDHFFVMVLRQQCIGFADGGDTVIIDGDSTIGDDVSRGVHGDDGGVGEKHNGHSPVAGHRNIASLSVMGQIYHEMEVCSMVLKDSRAFPDS